MSGPAVVVPLTLLLIAFANVSLGAAPPLPPPAAAAPSFALTVELPDVRKLSTQVVDATDCPSEKFCGGDYYGIAGDLLEGFRKLGLRVREACVGPSGGRACHITQIDAVANSAGGRWVMYRNGYRNTYPYNQITRGFEPLHVVYRFIPSSKPLK